MISFLPFLAIVPFIFAKTHDVVVGGPGKLLYDPEYVHADVGDYVRFWFQQKNHTATQSSFNEPCTPLEHGFDSGFMPVPDSQKDNFPYFDVEVKDEKPVWVHCQQGDHCSQGMVFAINPADKFWTFKEKALQTKPPTSTYAPPYHGATPTYAPRSAPEDHHVIVGGDAGNVYTPNMVHAKKGDTITFEFRQKNHTVTQSSFDDPCRKLEFTSKTGEIGFDSGFMPVPAEQNDHFPTWTLTVEDDTKPIWAYCRQLTHCGQGMVFSVNADKASFDAFRDNAIRINGTTTTTTITPEPTHYPRSGWSAKFGKIAN